MHVFVEMSGTRLLILALHIWPTWETVCLYYACGSLGFTIGKGRTIQEGPCHTAWALSDSVIQEMGFQREKRVRYGSFGECHCGLLESFAVVEQNEFSVLGVGSNFH